MLTDSGDADLLVSGSCGSAAMKRTLDTSREIQIPNFDHDNHRTHGQEVLQTLVLHFSVTYLNTRVVSVH
jgi:hypothetical protein